MSRALNMPLDGLCVNYSQMSTFSLLLFPEWRYLCIRFYSPCYIARVSYAFVAVLVVNGDDSSSSSAFHIIAHTRALIQFHIIIPPKRDSFLYSLSTTVPTFTIISEEEAPTLQVTATGPLRWNARLDQKAVSRFISPVFVFAKMNHIILPELPTHHYHHHLLFDKVTTHKTQNHQSTFFILLCKLILSRMK